MASKKKSPESVSVLSDADLRDIVKEESCVIDVRIVRPSQVATAAWVRLKCQFGCDGYGQCLVCPPFTPTPQQTREVLDSYRRAILIHFKPESDVKATVADLERTIFLRGAWKAFSLGAGPCYFCKQCAVKEGACRHADRARPSMEACGIDVFTTVRRAGLPIQVVTTTRQCPNYYGLILVD